MIDKKLSVQIWMVVIQNRRSLVPSGLKSKNEDPAKGT
jgi:hypothetical protein